MTVGGAIAQRESNEVQVDRVQNKFDRHQHQHSIFTGDNAVHANAKQHGGKQEELINEHR
jgi:hypothetical protein